MPLAAFLGFHLAISWFTPLPVSAGSRTIALDSGISIVVTDGSGPSCCGSSFCVGDKFYIYVRPDIADPSQAALSARTVDGKITCSACHNQHSEASLPFDPNAPNPYVQGALRKCVGGTNEGNSCNNDSDCAGGGACTGRHFQRLANDTNQMCKDCHGARDVGVSAAKCVGGSNNGLSCTGSSNCSGGVCSSSHPVGVSIPGATGFKSPEKTITSVGNNGAGLIRVTSTAHGFANGQTVIIWGVSGTTGANGTWAITNVAADTFDLVGSTYVSNGTGGAAARIPLDSANQVECMSCHLVHDFNSAENATLLRVTNVASLCRDCHDLPADATHFTNANVAWPGDEHGSPASTYPAQTAAEAGYCTNCHQPHGWPDAADTAQDYSKLLVATKADLCFDCHDSTGPSTKDIYGAFNGTTNYRGSGTSGANINQRHDVSAADQTYSGGVVACANCHNPHYVTSTNKVMDPDSPTTSYTRTYAKTNSYTRDGYNDPYTNGAASGFFDPTNPEGCQSGGGASCTVTTQPDMVDFCLTCHDGTMPSGVTMSPNMFNIASNYFIQGVQHGSVAGNTGTQISKGYKKVPWTSTTNFNNGREPNSPYAALPCTYCHDGHGSGNLFHLKDSVTVAGVQMKVGGQGQCANNGNCGPWTVANGFNKSGNTTYKLPCTGGNGNPDCSLNPTGSQAYLYWGAWCSFCHTQSAHVSVTESTGCNSGHQHNGGNF